MVYKGDGTTFYKAIKLSYNNEDAQNPYYYFNVENGGYYYMYVVANCSLDLTAAAQTTTLSAGGPSSLFGLVETTDPGTDKQASTNFLMISGKTCRRALRHRRYGHHRFPDHQCRCYQACHQH